MNFKENNKKCEHAIQSLTEWLEYDEIDPRDVDLLISEHPECEEDIRSHLALWEELRSAEVPEPSGKMHAGFYRQLADAMEAEKQPVKVVSMVNSWINERSLFAKIASVAAVLLLGLWMGWQNGGEEIPIALSEDGLTPYRNLTYASTTPPITERLKLIQESKSFDTPEDPVIQALFMALTQDPNVNVRLSAIEALQQFAHMSQARESLIKSIPYQENALVQLTLAEATKEIMNGQAGALWKDVLESDAVDTDVKINLKDALKEVL